MVVQVAQRQKKPGILETLAPFAPAAGTLIGAGIGGPPGAIAGGAIGSAAAAGVGTAAKADAANDPSNAMQRRMGGPQASTSSDAPNPIEALENARIELASQPPEIRQQYEAPIRAALLQARRGQGVV